jgi:hypothetical protein
MTAGAAIKSAEYSHALVFYEDEQSLGRTVADFLAPALGDAAAAIVVASPSRQTVILKELAGRGLNVEELKRAGDLQIVDSDRLLERIMSGADPNPARFRAAVEELIERACRGRQGWTVRAYGDAVDLLWKRGNPEGAIRLEVLWNRFTTHAQFSLLCAYGASNFSKRVDGRPHQQAVCDQHNRIIEPVVG